MEVKSAGKSWQVEYRYSEFRTLYQQVRNTGKVTVQLKGLKKVGNLKFPEKKILNKSLDVI